MKAKTHDGTKNLKMRATSNLQVKCAEKNGALQNCHILFYAYFSILCNLPSKKNLPLVFNFFTSPQFFSRRHLPPPVKGVDAPAKVHWTCFA